jgi:D-alanine-D-alanine ligase
MKTRIAVFLGGRSPEHDVSVVTGLQALRALDQARFDAFVVYISPQGDWLVGPGLDERRNYLPDTQLRAKLSEVTLDIAPGGIGRLLPRKSGLFSRRPPVEFDVALLAFHGLGGEDGQIQGLFEAANIPHTGMRTMASSVFMDKVATKRMLESSGIPLLRQAVIDRPATGLPAAAALTEAMRLANVGFPCIVKPVHLGSSIGVGKADTVEEARALLAAIFRLDMQALIEPFVPNLVEYNISVGRFGGPTRCSAIERPKRVEALLDFRQKYLSGGGENKTGGKTLGASSQGMLSLTREINPDVPPQFADNLRRWAAAAFEAVGGTGAPRIDFLSNEATGEVWLNEVNPCPGSFGFYLWEAAPNPPDGSGPLGFTALLSLLIDEAQARHRAVQLPDDPVPQDARLLKRP